jgi:hypothetical protein
MKTSVTSPKSLTGAKSGRKGNGAVPVLSAKAAKKWSFAPDAIGMFNGPRDLSRRRGLSG